MTNRSAAPERMIMDPNATLDRMRLLSAMIVSGLGNTTTALELANAVVDLDEWLSRDGYTPTDWAKRR